MSVGENFAMNNGVHGNPIGCYEKCTFFVGTQGRLKIGNNVGVSQCSLVAVTDLYIGDYVKIGGVVWSLLPISIRLTRKREKERMIS